MHPNKIKVNFVGSTMVGKTTILNRMRTGVFNPDTMATVGGSFITLIKDKTNFEIWDTAGQERYLSLIPMYFRDVKMVLFVFDVNSISSIKYINKYRDIICDKPNIKIIILGNKTDLLEEYSVEELILEVNKNFLELELTDKIHGLYFISAKEGNNFDKFLEHFYECAKTLPVNNLNTNISVFDLNNNNNDGSIDNHNIEKKCCY